MKKIILSIDGMTCSACSNGLEKYLNKQDGIISATVNLVMATASISYEDTLSIKELETYIQEAGFYSKGIAKLEEKEKKPSIKPFVIFGLLAFILMYLSMAPMLALPTIPLFHMMNHPIYYALILLLLTIPFLIYGRDIIKNGVKNLYYKMPNMDTLVSIGIISSFLYSLLGVILILYGHPDYVHHLYFESTVFVIYFIKLGRFIDQSSKEKTKDAIQKLVMITPKTAKRKTKDGIQEITIDEVQVGDMLICLAGDKIAVDGVITKGETHLDEAFITGESKPVRKKEQDLVIAGSINYDGVIEYQAEKIGKESTISEIINLVLEAINTKAPISLLADKISSYFVPIILILAILTLFGSLLLKIPFDTSLIRFVTVLVVACPCALGLATPLAIVISEGTCAKKGILVKSSETLEIASKINTVVFDKTGTLTQGNLTIANVHNYTEKSEKEILSILGSIEANSTHPIAKGIMRFITEQKITLQDQFTTETLAGYGIKAWNQEATYYVGNAKLLDQLKIENSYKKEELSLTKQGNSIVYLIEDNHILGLFGIKDTIRIDAKTVIQRLKEEKIEVLMLTGDHKNVAQIVGQELGIEKIFANVIPKEKAQVIKQLKEEGKRVLMVGDGINDAPSLTLADVGVSMSSGTDIATDSASVILMNNDLTRLLDLLTISKKTLQNIKENLFWAFLYNLSMIPIAMGLLSPWNITINPMIACLAMIFSSLFVIFNALRLKK